MPAVAKLHQLHPLIEEEQLRAISSKLFDSACLSAKDCAALQEYKGSGFAIMNRMLRSGQYPVVRFKLMLHALVKQLIAARSQPRVIDKRPMWEQEDDAKEQLTSSYLDQVNGTIGLVADLDSIFAKQRKRSISQALLRGVNSYDAKHKVGDLIAFPEFLSTTLSAKVAWGYNYTSQDGALFVFKVCSRHMPWILLTYGMDDPNARHNNEYEVLLPRGTQWRVAKKYMTSMSPAEAAACQFVGITPDEAVHKTRAYPIQVYELESLPLTKACPITPLRTAPQELLVMPWVAEPLVCT